MKIKLGIITFLCLVSTVQARYVSIKNEKQFHDQVNKFDYALVAFVQFPDGKSYEDKDMKKDIGLVKDTVKALADTEPFKKDLKDEVGFVFVDVSKEGLTPIVEKYEIQVDENPHFLLFKNGKPLTELSGNKVELEGFVAKSDLLAFMNDDFGKEFDDILEKKSDEVAQEREMQLARLQASSAARYPYGFYSPFNPWGSPSPYIYSGYAAFYPYGYSYNGYAYYIP